MVAEEGMSVEMKCESRRVKAVEYLRGAGSGLVRSRSVRQGRRSARRGKVDPAPAHGVQARQDHARARLRWIKDTDQNCESCQSSPKSLLNSSTPIRSLSSPSSSPSAALA